MSRFPPSATLAGARSVASAEQLRASGRNCAANGLYHFIWKRVTVLFGSPNRLYILHCGTANTIACSDILLLALFSPPHVLRRDTSKSIKCSTSFKALAAPARLTAILTDPKLEIHLNVNQALVVGATRCCRKPLMSSSVVCTR